MMLLSELVGLARHGGDDGTRGDNGENDQTARNPALKVGNHETDKFLGVYRVSSSHEHQLFSEWLSTDDHKRGNVCFVPREEVSSRWIVLNSAADSLDVSDGHGYLVARTRIQIQNQN